MALNALSTLDEINAAYAENASYLEDGSPDKARQFITACRLLILMLPRRATKGGRNQGEEIELQPQLLKDQIDEARRFLTQVAITYGPTTVFSIENFREDCEPPFPFCR
jgi:hypothetical protein